MKRSVSVLLLVAAVAIAGCRPGDPVYNATDVAYSPIAARSTLSRTDYRDAIIRAGTERGWTFQEAGPGHLVGNLAVRGKHFATVDVLYDTESFTINYRDSRNLEYDPATRQIHPNYNSWVQNLQQEIQAEVIRLETS